MLLKGPLLQEKMMGTNPEKYDSEKQNGKEG